MSVGVLEADLIGPTVWCWVMHVKYHFSAPGFSVKQVVPFIASLLLQVQDWNGFCDQNWESSESYGGRGFRQVYSIYLPLSYIGFLISINFKIMGTSVQQNFFLAMWELFIDELFNKCFNLQENAKKNFKW